jgi:hypothetical protein
VQEWLKTIAMDFTDIALNVEIKFPSAPHIAPLHSGKGICMVDILRCPYHSLNVMVIEILRKISLNFIL